MTDMRKLLAVLLFAIVVLRAPNVGAQDKETDSNVARLVDEGIALGEAGNLLGARSKLLEAWALKKTFDIAANLGFAETQLKEWTAAAEHLDYALRTFPLSEPPASRQNIEKFRAEALAKVGRVTISTEPGAEIHVDGMLVGRTPLDGPLFVSPGDHRIAAKKTGKVDAENRLSIRAGQEVAVALELLSAGGGTDPVVAPRPVWPAILLGVVGGAGVVVGGTMFGLRAITASDLEGQSCPSGTECPEIDADVENHNVYGRTGISGFAIGGAALAAMVIYLAIPEPGARAAAVQVVPLAKGADGGASVVFSF